MHLSRTARCAALAAAACLVATAMGCGPHTVVRVFDGHEVEGRFIAVRAYAYYARAADAEAHGAVSDALELYRAAALEDAESPEIWTRIGALRCGARPSAGDAADAFARALERDPGYEPAHRERARCALRAGRAEEAVSEASEALLLDPERAETAILLANALERAGHVDVAARSLEALTVRAPSSPAGWRALYELARRARDPALAARSARALRELDPSAALALERDVAGLRPLTEIDAALSNGDLGAARRRSLGAHLSASELGVRAAALGLSAVAARQAELVAAADPSDASARIALAVAADLAGDGDTLSRALTALPSPLTPPSRLARLLLAELLERRVGVDAARAWLDPAPPATDDPLLARVEARVAARLYPSEFRPGAAPAVKP